MTKVAHIYRTNVAPDRATNHAPFALCFEPRNWAAPVDEDTEVCWECLLKAQAHLDPISSQPSSQA